MSKLKTGEYFVEKRMMLSVSVYENGKRINEYNALNDAVITSGFIARIIDISVAVGGRADYRPAYPEHVYYADLLTFSFRKADIVRHREYNKS